MTWSCLINADMAISQGLETLVVPSGNFRVKIRPDGLSDWITLVGDECPIEGGVKVSVTSSIGDLAGIRADVVDWKFVTKFRVHGTPETAAKQGRYMVSVDGLLAPSKEHETLEAAIADAQILGARPANATNTVRVLQVVATLPPVGERQVVMAKAAA